MDCDIIHLLHRVNQLATEAWTAAGGPKGISHRQHLILAAVAAEEGLSQTDLVKRTGIDRSTLADIVRRMSQSGLLKRERTKEDTRAYRVTVGDRGKEVLKATKAAQRRANASLLGSVPKEQREALTAALAAMSGVDRAA